MAAPLRSTPHLSTVPASQNTAPVAEFRCLFTHDIRRKQKRWQDGYLKFHTFNNRVMVYDSSRNFLGDTYIKDRDMVDEGDEFSLDKPVMVQVDEAMGVTQTDLTPLLDKKSRESPQAKPAAPAPMPRLAGPTAGGVRNASQQLRHKSLNTLLGTPRGPVGKAVAIKSPYELRHEKDSGKENCRPAKRLKMTHEVSSKSSSPLPVVNKVDPPVWARTSDAKRKSNPPPRPSSIEDVTIVLDDSTPDITSNITLPSTSPPQSRHRTPHIPQGKGSLPRSKPKEPPKQPLRLLSPPVSVSNNMPNTNAVVIAAENPQKESVPPNNSTRDVRTKSLRLSKGVKRGMLLCQNSQQKRATSTAAPEKLAKKTKLKATERDEGGLNSSIYEPPPWPSDEESLSPAELDKSQACIMNQPPHAESKPTSRIPQSDDLALIRELGDTTDLFSDEDMATIHGRMDQRLLAKPHPTMKTSSRAPPPSKVTEPAKAQASLLKDVVPPAARPPNAKVVPKHKHPTAPKTPGKSQSPPKAIFSIPSSPEPVLSSPSPSPIKAQSLLSKDIRDSRPGSGSVSAAKLPFSTGGFTKKQKKTKAVPAPVSVLQVNTCGPPPAASETRQAPLMSTTKLSKLLQKQKQAQDPIEDSSQPATNMSPGRSFRRVRSANDAPIPSQADAWERNNVASAADGKRGGRGKEKAKTGGLANLIYKTDPRRKFQRTKSLDTDTSMVRDGGREVSPLLALEVVDKDIGPWSTEASDLFDWRPPGRRDGEKGVGMLVDGE